MDIYVLGWRWRKKEEGGGRRTREEGVLYIGMGEVR